MKISKETIKILQNFSSINQSIRFEEGNEIRTVSLTETVFASATVPETFPMTAAIYDLPKLLGLLTLDKENSELIFEKNHMVIKQGKSTTKYSYCNQDLIKTPPSKDKKINIKNKVADLVIKNEDYQSLIKAMNILGLSEVAIVGEDGSLSLQTLSTRNETSDIYKTVLGETEKTFSAIIDAEHLKLLPLEYMVTISSNPAVIHFNSTDTEFPKIEYWIALSMKSQFYED